MVAKAKTAPKSAPVPKTIGTEDDDIKRIIATFKATKGYATHSQALEKLLMRAERLNLHRMNDEEADALLDLHLEAIRK